MIVKKPLLYNRIGRLVRFTFSAALLTLSNTVVHAQEEQRHPDSLSADSALLQPRPVMRMAMMALPSPPSISYSVPSVLQVGVSVSYSPTNSGGAVYADGDVTDFVGSGVQGYLDGTGTAARFNTPSAMVLDGSGNLYVAESGNHRIRRVTPAGVVTTFAGSGVAGTADGTGTSASFNNPAAMVFDASGNLYVVDRSNHRIRRVTPAGVVTTVAGSTLGYQDGTGTAARFNAPFGIVLESSGNLLVVDQANLRIRRVTPAGVVTTFVGSGSVGGTNGTGTAASFDYPHSICKDGSGNFYVTENTGHRVRRITPAGVVTTFAGTGSAGSANGTGTSASFNRPVGISLEPTGSFLMTELHGYRIRRISSTGVVTTVAGTGSPGTENGPPLSASFNYPSGAHVSASGTIYITDQLNHRVRKMGTEQGYTISPALPAGMTFNKTTGVIGGTPTSATASTTYTITAYNAGGSFPRTVTFSVASSGVFSSNQNYILKTTYLTGFTAAQADPATGSAMRDITYYDGMGRPMQDIGIKATKDMDKDVVTPIAYDGFGRQDRDYLPYATTTGVGGAFKSSATTQQASYYSGATTVPAGQSVTSHAFSQRKYEASPLNRVQEQGFPGATWQPASSRGAASGRTVQNDYATNDAVAGFGPTSRRVARYIATINATTGARTLSLNGIYAAGELYVSITRYENWTSADGRNGTVEEYTDKQGRVLLKRTYNAGEALSTYYVYDDFGLLSFVLPPGRGTEFNPDAATVPTPASLELFAYQYRYDQRGRLVEKKLPGKGWEYILYNGLDQVVGTQDAKQRARNPQEWTVTKYDGLKRTVTTGLWYQGTTPGANNRAAVQALVNTHTGQNQWEERNATGNAYTSRAWPATGIATVLTEHYYDNYNVLGLPAAYKPTGYSAMTHGRPTATRVKVLNEGTGTANMLWEAYHYNDKGQVLRSYRQHFHGGGTASEHDYDETTDVYNFTGQVTKSTRRHFTGSTSAALQVTVVTDYEYDHRLRPTRTWKTTYHPSTTPVPARTLIAQQNYNEVGQLHTKELDKANATATARQVVTYGYNERGWLRTANTNGNLFNMELFYNTGGGTQYNGNIALQRWTTSGQAQKTYTYTYDRLNRLMAGTSTVAAQSETGITYDRNGNILSLKRGTAAAQAYTYTDWGNRLKTVTGGATRTYTYDANGNVETDGQGNTFNYNLLNLPSSVTGTHAATYTYDATGRKLRRVKGGVATEYIDGIQYNGAAIDFIQTEVGRVVKATANNSYRYEYTLTDHLGNARVNFDINGTAARVIQSTDYHPFGMEIPVYTLGVKNPYLYNGKELQEGINQYDYGARFYDPVIGRWGGADLLAELAPHLTPYRYCFNNPIKYVDPFGLWEQTAGGYKTDKKEEIERFILYLNIENNTLKTKPGISDISGFIDGEMSESGLGKLSDGSKLLSPLNVYTYKKIGGGIGMSADRKDFDNFWHQVQGRLTPEALDPRTIGNNYFGMSYPGPSNPRKYNGKDDYSHLPADIVEYPGLFHDLRYDKLGLKGADGLLRDKRAIPADNDFVMEQMIIGSMSTNPWVKFRAYSLGYGLGVLSVPKRIGLLTPRDTVEKK